MIKLLNYNSKDNTNKILNKFLIFLLITITIIISIFSFSLKVSAETGSDYSIIGDYFSKVFDIELDNGHNILDTEEDDKDREKINDSIYDGTSNKTYSLYDRFGSSLYFIPYFGEKRIETFVLVSFYVVFFKKV